MAQTRFPSRVKTLTLALSAALSTLIPISVRADGGSITVFSNNSISASGNLIGVSNLGVLTGLNTSNGTIGTLFNAGSGAINASGQSAGSIRIDGAVGVLSNAGTITASGKSNGGIRLSSIGSIGSLSNTGAISVSGTSNGGGIRSSGSIGVLSNGGTISSSSKGGGDIRNGGTIGTLVNSGSAIFSGNDASYNGSNHSAIGNSGVIGLMANSGSGTIIISGASSHGLGNGTSNGSVGTVGTLINSGNISASANGDRAIFNDGTISILNNYGNIALSPGGTIGIMDGDGIHNDAGAYIGTLTNGTIGMLGNGTIGTLGTISTSGQSGGGVHNSGTIGVLNNVGAISASSQYGGGIRNGNTGSIGLLSNSGDISVSGYSSGGIRISGGVATLNNSGLITDTGARSGAIRANGTIQTLTNSGTLMSSGVSSNGIGLGDGTTGSIGTLINSGLITIGAGATCGLVNGTACGSIQSSISTIYGGYSGEGIRNYLGGAITSLSNSGTIIASDKLYAGGIGNFSTIGALTNSGLILASGSSSGGIGNFGLANRVGSITTHYSGSIAALTNSTTGTIQVSGQSGAGIYNGSMNSDVGAGIGTLTNNGLIAAGGTIAGNRTIGYSLTGNANHALAINNDNSGSIGLLNNTGYIVSRGSQSGGIGNFGSVQTLLNSGTINAGGAGAIGIYNASHSSNNSITHAGSIGTLTNSGLITIGASATSTSNSISSGTAIRNGDGAYIGLLTNDTGGTISIADQMTAGVMNDNGATIGTLLNNGLLASSGSTAAAAGNSGTIGILINTGIIKGSGNTTIGLSGALGNFGVLTVLDNSGTLLGNGGAAFALVNTAEPHCSGSCTDSPVSIGTLSNSGLIEVTSGAGVAAVENTSIGTINQLINTASGIITITSAAGEAISNLGMIGTLTNAGTLSAGGTAGIALYNGSTGTISSLSNSGLISGAACAISNSGSLGTLTNTGVIAGNIETSQPLTIVGGISSVVGTLTGYGGSIGSITTGSANLMFAGNVLLNDNINAGSGTVSNSGAVQINHQVTVTGNYSQTGGTLTFGMTTPSTTGSPDDTGYGRLVVSGIADINSVSTISMQALGSTPFAGGQRYLVVEGGLGSGYAIGSITLQASDYNGNLSSTNYADSSHSDLLVCLSASCPGIVVNGEGRVSASGAVSGLSNYTGINSDLMSLNNSVDALGSGSAGAVASAQLSPATTAVADADAAFAPTQETLNLVAAHVDGLRDGESGVSAGESGTSLAVWGEGFGGQVNQSARDTVSGFRASYNGLLIGADAALGEHWRAGGLISYGNTSVADNGANSGSGTHLDSYGLIGYASYAGSQWYLDLSAGVVQHQYTTTRVINVADGAAFGQFNGMQYVFSAVGGYPIKLDSLLPGATLTPIAGLSYSILDQDAYTETGGNGAALHMDAARSTSLKSDLGGKLERTVTTNFGDLIPSVQLGWRHEYQNTRLQTTANYAADTSGSTAFTSAGPGPVSNTGVVTLGLTLLHGRNLTLTAKYEFEGASGYSAQTGDVSARWQF